MFLFYFTHATSSFCHMTPKKTLSLILQAVCEWEATA